MRLRVPRAGPVAIAIAALLVAACGGAYRPPALQGPASQEPSSQASQPAGPLVGIDLPDASPDARWAVDGASIVASLTALGYQADLQYADNDAGTQISQISAMVSGGVKLLVIGAVDATSLTATLQKAADAGVKVLAYDRLIRDSANVNAYVSFDNVGVGALQAGSIEQSLGLKTKPGPFTVELFAGSPDDNNAGLLFTGAMSVLQPYITSGKLVVPSGQTAFPGQVATQDWNPGTARARLTNILGGYGAKRLDAVLSQADILSSGIIASLKEAGYYTAAKPAPVVTGQDAVVDTVKSILAGEQTSTVFKDTRLLGAQAAKMVDQMLKGTPVDTTDTTSFNNGATVVPTFLLHVVLVTKDNVKAALLDSGFYTAAQLP